MGRNNTMERGEFIWAQIYWTGIAFYWYWMVLFRPVGSLDASVSVWVLAGILICCVLVGTAFCWRRYRNGQSVLITDGIGFGIYFGLTFSPFWSRIAWTVVIAGLALSAVYGTVELCGLRRSRAWTRRPARGYWVRRILRNILLCNAAASLLLIGAGGTKALLHRPVVEAPAKTVPEEVAKWTVQNNLETLALLQDGVWQTLSLEERLEVLQTIANIEQNYLGLPFPLRVGADNLEENTEGNYNDAQGRIRVSLTTLSDNSENASWNLVDCVAHEAYHSYQHRLVDLYWSSSEEERNLILFERIRVYIREFNNYEDGSDFAAYYTQLCESDARNYASDAVTEYYARVMSYLEERETGQGSGG